MSEEDKDVASCDIFEAVQLIVKPRRRGVSLSSTDSEPIVRPRKAHDVNEGSSVSASDDELEPAHDTRGAMGEVAMDFADLLARSDVLTETPLVCLSEASVATVSSLAQRESALVAESCDHDVVLDVGTRLCLEDGTTVGVIGSMLGPIHAAYYVVALDTDRMSTLVTHNKLRVGTALHCDVRSMQLIYDPLVQCDAAKGTDASYVNDEELPEHVRPDFSDDEKELAWKRARKVRRLENDSLNSSSSEDVVEVDWANIAWDEAEDITAPPPNPVQHPPSLREQHPPLPHIPVPAWLQ